MASTDLAVLLWCREITDMGNVRRSSVSNPLSRHVGFAWIINRRLDILWVLRQIVPYMHIKAATADRMIEEIEMYQGPRIAPGWTTTTPRVIAASSRDI